MDRWEQLVAKAILASPRDVLLGLVTRVARVVCTAGRRGCVPWCRCVGGELSLTCNADSCHGVSAVRCQPPYSAPLQTR